MTDFEIREDQLSGETVYYATHPTGLKIAVYPKKSIHLSCAYLGVGFGSIHNDFSVDGGEFTRVPDGIAHYLEHLLFENEDCKANDRFNQLGAKANAFTGYNKTAYYFNCIDHFYDSLEELMGFVQKPYFTEENVRKERGIIEQELKMHFDQPGHKLYSNFLTSLYPDHPISIDIGGSLESISRITPELLYQCYEAFYTPDNMVLTVAGNVDPYGVLEKCDELILPKQGRKSVTRIPPENNAVVQPFIEQEADVSMPLFKLGLKQKCRESNSREFMLFEIVQASIFGVISDFQSRMEEKDLITSDFSFGGMCYEGVNLTSFGGMSRSPEALRDEIFEEIERVKREGLSPNLFECSRRDSYASQLVSFNGVMGTARSLMTDLLTGTDTFDMLHAAADVNVEEGYDEFMRSFDISNHVLSVVRQNKEA